MRGRETDIFSFLTFCWTTLHLELHILFVVRRRCPERKQKVFYTWCDLFGRDMSYSRPPNNFTPSLLLNAHEARHARLSMLGNIAAHQGQNQQQGHPPLQNQHQQQGQNQNQPGQLPPPLNGQDLNLSNILHYLQLEWRRYERERNEWEIERAEMRVRVPFVSLYTS